MFDRLAAFGVHAFTALGAVLGFLALIAAAGHRWEDAFGWLGIALVVDGLDGPLARRIGVKDKLPRFSGEHLDLVIDYLTYVVVPAYIIYEAKLVPSGLGLVTAVLILLTSLYHFSDSESKTEDGFFVGFPALWNVVALYGFIFQVPPPLAFAVLILLVVLTFFPFKWIHPVRVRRLRPITFCVMALWTVAAVAALLQGLPGSLAIKATIALATAYLIAIGVARSLREGEGSAFTE
jgi:phosphatidylcholine synthase